jgi:hypothetical protein
MSTKLPALMAGFALSCAVAPAMARDIAIDGDPSFAVSACSIGSSCSGTTLPFSIITPAVTTNQIFIYNSGIVSLGSALPLTAAYGDVGSLGHAFLAPGFGDFGGNVPTTYITNVHDGFPGFTGGFRVTWAFPNVDGSPIFQVEFIDLSLSVVIDPNAPDGFFIQQDPTKIGDVLVNFAHGSTFDFWNGLTVGTDPGLPNPSLIGWGVGALNSATTYTGDVEGLRAANFSVNLTDAAAYDPGIPEPATWVILILGFAAVGAALRRARGRRVPTGA